MAVTKKYTYQPTVHEVVKLREYSGEDMMNCKKALVYSDGDWNKAVAYLKAKGLAVATSNLTFDERVEIFLESEEFIYE